MDGTAHVPAVGCSKITRRNHIRPDRQPDEHIDHKVIQTYRRPDRRHGFVRRIMTDDNQVHRVEQQLKNIGDHQRHRKKHDLPEQRSATHINLIIVCSHFPVFSHCSAVFLSLFSRIGGLMESCFYGIRTIAWKLLFFKPGSCFLEKLFTPHCRGRRGKRERGGNGGGTTVEERRKGEAAQKGHLSSMAPQVSPAPAVTRSRRSSFFTFPSRAIS